MKYKLIISAAVTIIAIIVTGLIMFSYKPVPGEEKETGEIPPIGEIILALKDKEMEVREKAMAQLAEKAKKGLAVNESRLLLDAAIEDYPPNKYEFIDTPLSVDKTSIVKSIPRVD